MYEVYILKSINFQRHYIGYTGNLGRFVPQKLTASGN